MSDTKKKELIGSKLRKLGILTEKLSKKEKALNSKKHLKRVQQLSQIVIAGACGEINFTSNNCIQSKQENDLGHCITGNGEVDNQACSISPSTDEMLCIRSEQESEVCIISPNVQSSVEVSSCMTIADCTQIVQKQLENNCCEPFESDDCTLFEPFCTVFENYDPYEFIETIIEFTERKITKLSNEYRSVLNTVLNLNKGLRIFEYLELVSIRKINHYYILKSSLFDLNINRSTNLLMLNNQINNEEKLLNKPRITSNFN